MQAVGDRPVANGPESVTWYETRCMVCACNFGGAEGAEGCVGGECNDTGRGERQTLVRKSRGLNRPSAGRPLPLVTHWILILRQSGKAGRVGTNDV
jgi:hypothetical protein